MPERVAIIGDGQMGLVMAWLLAEKGVPCTLWGPFDDAIRALAETRRSLRMPALELPRVVAVTSDGAAALRNATIAVSAIPTQYMRRVWERLAPARPGPCLLVSVAKGFETGSHVRPSEILSDVCGPAGVVALTGPTIAPELARRLPATMIAASDQESLARQTQAAFSTGWLRIYTHDDLVGVEVAGAAKNIIAIAAGLIDGLELGYNAKSALLARGLSEIARLGAALGARAETFFGIAGVGDLATTCFSPEGRNRSCGEAIARGTSVKEYVAASRSVVEGIDTAQSVNELADQLGLDLPIMKAVYRILFEAQTPAAAIRDLMGREAKAERVG